ncbi:MAG: HEAT repeat domain-containing protein [Myxococcota bacterium]
MTTLSYTKIALASALCSALALSVASPAEAGVGGSNARIQNAINTGSAEAIIAEVERAERLVCGTCITTVMTLLDDERYEVREVAAWWFARRPAQKTELAERSLAQLAVGDSIATRNAADILGAFRLPSAVPALALAAQRGDISAEARVHAVRAIGLIASKRGNDALATAMTDSESSVRLAAVTAWHNVRFQRGAAPVGVLVADSDTQVRRKAAAVLGNLREASARVAIEQQLAGETDPMTRRNLAWALGRIGDRASEDILRAATEDPSPLVRMTARAALRQLR